MEERQSTIFSFVVFWVTIGVPHLTTLFSMPIKKNPRDIVVPCSGGHHPVRLARGRRFWRSARCPVCRAPVDPNRTRRFLRWLTNLGRPASAGWLHQLVWWGSLSFLILALVALGLIWGLSDRWWPATVLLFGPRWILLLPLSVLLPLASFRDRPLVFPLVLAGLTVIGPVMGFQLGWRSLFPGESQVRDLQVVSFNALGGNSLIRTPANLLADWGVDIIAFQECGTELGAALRRIPGWHVDTRSGLCLVSRFEIVDVAEMEREALQFAGGAGVVATYELDLDGEPLFLTNLHLETPRAGFELIRAGRLRGGILKVREKSLLRTIELRQARAWTDGFDGPHLVLGDFNTPQESRPYRQAWAGWQNTFSLAGSGLGGTRLNGWIRVRIDHILANEEWKVMEAWLEEDVGSDHLPIAARIRPR